MELAMELLLPPPVLQMDPEVHPAQLATAPPPPRLKQNLLNHPPYAKMIVTAIKTLNEKKGSSKKAIAKFINSTYSNLPVSHSALLTHHLKRLKKKGIVLMLKHSYKLPKSLPTSTATSSSDPLLHSSKEQKRGRGRPPKPKTVIFPSPNGLEIGLPLLIKKGPGRPPKSNSIKRGSGRPSKSNSTPNPNPKPNINGLEKGRRPIGRPRKDASARTAVTATVPSIAIVPAVLGKRGRPRGPPKVRGPLKPKRVSITGRPVGRPKKAKIADGIAGGGGGGGGEVFLIGSDGEVVGGGGELAVVMGGGGVEIKRGRGRPPKKVGGGIGGGAVKTKC